MAKKWAEVVSNPEFVAMPYETKLEVRQEYFENVVAPHVPEEYRTAERLKFETYAAIDAPKRGAGAAFGSSVDRIQGGLQQVLGFDEAAEANIKESQKYEPKVQSYKDVNSIGSFLDYTGELVAGSAPYLAGPLLATGAAVAGAPIAIPAAITGGVTVLSGLAEGGATYAEMPADQKSIPRAAVVGTTSAVMERFGIRNKAVNNLIMNSPLLRPLKGAVEETVSSGVQAVVSGTVGQGQSFTEVMSNLDESIVAGVVTRTAYSTPTVVSSNIPTAKKKASEFIWGGRDEDGNRTESYHTTSKLGEDNIKMDSASDLAAVDVDAGIKEAQRVWASRELQNSAEAAKKLQDRGAELSPVSLDINTTDASGKQLNIAEEFNIGTAGDKLGRTLASTFKMPLFGELVDPKKGYESTKRAFEGLKSDFDISMKREIGSLGLDKDITTDMLRDIQNYVSGRKPRTDAETKQFILQSPNKLEIFDSITQMKRMRQMTENMAPRGDKGSLGGIGGIGLEALATGSIPFVTPTLGAIGSSLAAIMNKTQKSKMESIIDGKGTPESKLRAIMKALDGVDLGKSGITSAEELEEEVKERVKPDMGTLELVK